LAEFAAKLAYYPCCTELIGREFGFFSADRLFFLIASLTEFGDVENQRNLDLAIPWCLDAVSNTILLRVVRAGEMLGGLRWSRWMKSNSKILWDRQHGERQRDHEVIRAAANRLRPRTVARAGFWNHRY
jgi:hypothetical protein